MSDAEPVKLQLNLLDETKIDLMVKVFSSI
jgi:hypothetical protein